MFKPRQQFAIGDVHGHYDELMALYKQLQEQYVFDPRLDQLILLGDLVDVGPKTKEVIQQCMAWEREYNTLEEKHFIFLYGNHEDMLVDALNPLHPIYENNPETWVVRNHGDATLKSYYPKLDKLSKKAFEKARQHPDKYLDDEHVRWLGRLPYFYIDENYVFVHAGLPNEPLEIIIDKAGKNDQQLNYDMIWIRDPFVYSNYDWEKRVIFAHTPTVEPIVKPNKVGINTMPRNEGKLTALLLQTMQFIYQPKL